ncbi:tetratricopeptide repeat protein [Hyalangium sp.]|uniref:tetratricopeptide repeat protein n=1 Tax=Hyalangium sp. TaxID=2028555 RepID=UPI002D41A55F|nr:tetratricopeptide repeat protein [Hyalangium sp.]HYH96987.1 tetratricopeptide repeat protein [Hyalangium sp.]
MAKSMVERYEQLLLQDPTSAVFVELAKVHLEKGEHARAIEVCQQGLGHHPQSVIGRVLWGKALLHQGKPAQAMEQFDQAIAVDKENAHAYNLIGEVLVQRGLFRSALPILRKAAALQPNDGRVRLWLEQTQQALSGGPPPVVAELPGITSNELAPKPEVEEPAAPKAEAAAALVPPPPPEEEAAAPPPPPPSWEDEDRGDITRQFTAIKVDHFPGEEPPSRKEPLPSEAKTSGEGTPSRGLAKVYMFPPRKGARPPPPPEEDDLADTPPPYAGSRPDYDEDTPIPGAEARESRVEQREGSSGGLLPDVDTPDEQGLPPEGDGPASSQDDDDGQELPPEPETQPAVTAVRRAPGSSGGGLLGDLPLPDEEDLPAVPSAARVSTSARPPVSSRSRAASGGAAKRALLDDIPEAVERPITSGSGRPKATSQVDAAEAAAAYEKELRDKIAKSAAAPSFLQRYGLKLAASAVLVVVLGVGLGVYLFRRAAQGGQTLVEVLERTDRAISQDTRTAFRDALAMLDRAQEMDDDNPRAWALRAYTYALLYSDHGGLAEDRQQALMALEQPGVRTEHPGLSLATDVLVADDKARPTVRRVLMDSKEDSSELHSLAGTLLLEEKQPEKALEHFKRALELSARNVRALVSLGQYYQDFDDYPNALNVYGTAHELSPEHPMARIGLAESRIALGQELNEAHTDMQALGGDAALPEALRARQRLIHGRLLAGLGRQDEALPLLESGAQGEGPLVFDFLLALGDASRASGKLTKAQEAYEAALKMKPKSEAAFEGLGRALLDRDRVKEALEKLGKAEGRRVSLVRAAAYARQKDWKRVRAELEKTKVNNLFVPEAVGYMAMADAADGNGEQAREVLEKTTKGSKQPRTDLRVALGLVYWELGAMDKARTELEEAMKDPRDYEAACGLGRLLLARGLPDLALQPLTRAVERNGFHGEAREALGRALLALGRTEEGLKQFTAWKDENPESLDAQKGYIQALLRSGKPQQATEAVRAAKFALNDVVGQRLRALVLFSSGDLNAGIVALKRAAAANSRDPETFCEIAHTFLRQDKPEDAAGAFEKVRTDSPDAICGLVGEHYVYPEDGGKPAAEALKSLANRAPTVWDKAFAQTAIARVLLSTPGSLKAARAAAEEAVKLDPFNGRTHLALGLVALKQRQEEPALAALNKAVELDPANAMGRLALADVLVRKQEELPRAIQEYEAFLKLAPASETAKRVKKALPNLKRRVK